MTSEVKERPRLITAAYGQHRSQWVNRPAVLHAQGFILEVKTFYMHA